MKGYLSGFECVPVFRSGAFHLGVKPVFIAAFEAVFGYDESVFRSGRSELPREIGASRFLESGKFRRVWEWPSDNLGNRRCRRSVPC